MLLLRDNVSKSWENVAIWIHFHLYITHLGSNSSALRRILLTLSGIRTGDRNYPVYIGEIKSPDDRIAKQRWIPPVVSTYLGVSCTTINQFLQKRITSCDRNYLTACRKAWLRETLHALYSVVHRVDSGVDLASFPGSTSSAFRIVFETVGAWKQRG